MDKPTLELKGFAKTSLLKPGASETLTFILTEKDFASFDTAQSAWVAEAGNYIVKIDASCEDIKLDKPFKLAKDIPNDVLEKGYAIVGVGYRMSPKAKAPAYIEDAAAATAWVFKEEVPV